MSSIFAPNGRKLQTILYTGIASVFSRFYPAYAVSYTNTAAERFNTFIKDSYISRGSPISESSAVWLWSLTLNCLFIGSFLGNLLTPLCTDRLGRKTAAVVGIYGMLLACVLDTLSVGLNLPELYVISRIFGSMMFSEAVSSDVRGTCFFVCEVSFTAIMFLGMVFAVSLIPTILCCFLTLQFRESPKFLILTRGDRQEAKRVLAFYQGDQVDFEKFLEETLQEEDTCCKTSLKTIIKDLFSERYLRKAILLGIAGLQLSSGVWPITTELLSAHFPGTGAQIYSSVLFGSNFVAGIVGVFAVGNISRRKLLLATSVIHIVSLATYVGFDRVAILWNPAFSCGCLLAMGVYNVTSGIGFGTIVYFLTCELLPQFHRSMGGTVVSLFSSPLLFVFSLLTLPAYKTYNVWAFIPLFVVPNALCTLYLHLGLPETSGREIYEIVNDLKASSKDKKMKKNSVETRTRKKDLELESMLSK